MGQTASEVKTETKRKGKQARHTQRKKDSVRQRAGQRAEAVARARDRCTHGEQGDKESKRGRRQFPSADSSSNGLGLGHAEAMSLELQLLLSWGNESPQNVDSSAFLGTLAKSWIENWIQPDASMR